MPAVDLRSETYGTFRSHDDSTQTVFTKEPKAARTYTFRDLDRRIIALVLALSIFTYHSMTFDHLLPIFFEDKRADWVSALAHAGPGFMFAPGGGLGLSVRAVGLIMAVNGVIALFVQAVIFPLAAEKVGVYRLYIAVTVLHPIAYLVMPFLTLVPDAWLLSLIHI